MINAIIHNKIFQGEYELFSSMLFMAIVIFAAGAYVGGFATMQWFRRQMGYPELTILREPEEAPRRYTLEDCPGCKKSLAHHFRLSNAQFLSMKKHTKTITCKECNTKSVWDVIGAPTCISWIEAKPVTSLKLGPNVQPKTLKRY